ncbi:MAG: response regulator transcription factor [Candidatus Obscuribacterales bacterium]|nr:response regulator transcription factor [Candidatus Obscuribacterales bacterium]
MADLLIVEDDFTLADTLSDWFAIAAHTVELAHTGSDGLAKMQEKEYDLVLLDWQLPNLQGIEVCKQYRTAGGASPILMFTGMKDPAYQEEALDAGADDVLPKPFDITQLDERVRVLLAMKK